MRDASVVVTPDFVKHTVINVRSAHDPVVLFDENDIEDTARELEIAGIIILVFSV